MPKIIDFIFTSGARRISLGSSDRWRLAFSDPTNQSGAITQSRNSSPIRRAPVSRKVSTSRQTGRRRTSRRKWRSFRKPAVRTGWPHAIVGYADMTVDDVRPQLDRLAKYPLLRGVRMQLHWHETPAFRFAPSADQLIDPKVRANVRRLKDYGLSFDLQLFPSQMEDGLQLVGENPETIFVLTHCGMLTADDPTTMDEWKAGLRTLAKAPNLYAKLSGLWHVRTQERPGAYLPDLRRRD